MTEEYVITPGGHRLKSLVHLVEAGHVLRMTKGHMQKIHPSGKVLADFGKIPSRPGKEPLMPGNVFVLPKKGKALSKTVVPDLGSGWITYASWNNGTGTPISSFKTTWIVPPEPTTQSGQLIYLFNGIQNSTMIFQPVLQWGNNGSFGGNYWLVASWYADGQDGLVFHGPHARVNPGDLLTGSITLTGQVVDVFSCSCGFLGIPDSGLSIQNVEELTMCVETLEAYRLTRPSDYPNTTVTQMKSINIQTGNVNPKIDWSPINLVTDVGQHCVVVSDSSTEGEVDLYYRIDGSLGSLGGPVAVTTGNLNDFDISKIRMKVFTVSTAGNELMKYFWDGKNWKWSPTVVLTAGYPAVTIRGNLDGVDDAMIHMDVFFRGTNGNLWVYYWDGNSWQLHDMNDLIPGVRPQLEMVGKPSVVAIGKLDGTDDSKVLVYVFVQGGNGHLWLYLWDGTNWTWEDTGYPPTGHPGDPVVTVRGKINDTDIRNIHMDVFFSNKNGNLLTYFWDGNNWNFSYMDFLVIGGLPVGFSANGTPAATPLKKLDGMDDSKVFRYVFVRPFYAGKISENLWVLFWDGKNWVVNKALEKNMPTFTIDAYVPYFLPGKNHPKFLITNQVIVSGTLSELIGGNLSDLIGSNPVHITISDQKNANPLFTRDVPVNPQTNTFSTTFVFPNTNSVPNGVYTVTGSYVYLPDKHASFSIPFLTIETFVPSSIQHAADRVLIRGMLSPNMVIGGNPVTITIFDKDFNAYFARDVFPDPQTGKFSTQYMFPDKVSLPPGEYTVTASYDKLPLAYASFSRPP